MKKNRSRKADTKLQKLWQFLVNELEIFKFIFLICYIMIGGFLFASKEASKYQFSLVELEEAQNKAIDDLNEIEIDVEKIAIYKDQPCKFGNIKKLLRNRAKEILHDYDLLQKNRTVEWTYGIAMYYSFVQITTIGYGDFVPATLEGKLLTVLYSAIGIPICISVFLKLGNLFALSLYNCWILIKHKVTKLYTKKVPLPLYSKNPMKIPMGFLINVNLLFIAACACILPYFSKLDYMDSYYFFVITMSTIGFGDIYPSRSNYTLVLFLTCFGIGLTATLFSKIRRYVQNKVENSLILYINKITKKDDFKPTGLDQVSASHMSFKSQGTTTDTSTKSEEMEEEVYVVDFERCHIM